MQISVVSILFILLLACNAPSTRFLILWHFKMKIYAFQANEIIAKLKNCIFSTHLVHFVSSSDVERRSERESVCACRVHPFVVFTVIYHNADRNLFPNKLNVYICLECVILSSVFFVHSFFQVNGKNKCNQKERHQLEKRWFWLRTKFYANWCPSNL